jgi:hypothetical protein
MVDYSGPPNPLQTQLDRESERRLTASHAASISHQLAQAEYDQRARDAAHEAAAAYIDEQTERALGDLPEQEKALKASSRRSKAT